MSHVNTEKNNLIITQTRVNVLLEDLCYSKFTSFFVSLNLSVPKKLNNIKSIKRLKGKNELSRFLNYILKKGKKLKFCIKILSILNNVYLEKNPNFLWKFYYFKDFNYIGLLFPSLYKNNNVNPNLKS